jgi:hypothetical protein
MGVVRRNEFNSLIISFIDANVGGKRLVETALPEKKSH